jgi:short-subunit dehydrogenase
LVARTGRALQSLADELREQFKVDARFFTIDLARPDAPGKVLNHVQAAGFKVDVLVNNAGFGAQGHFTQLPPERQLEMLQVNVTTLTHLTRLFLPGMVERRRGGVLNVASTAAFQPGPLMAVYYASKAFVLSLTEAIAEEVAASNVTVTALCPGPTNTNFAAAAEIRAARLFNKRAMSAAAVARAGHAGFRRGRCVVIPGASNKLLAFSVRLAPRVTARRVAGYLNAAKGKSSE